MHAVVLAAGRGERLGVLTDHRSKVMLPIGPRLLIDWNLTELAAAGVRSATIVHGYAGRRLLSHLGSGSQFGLELEFVDQGSMRGISGAVLSGVVASDHSEVLICNADSIVDADSIRDLIQMDGAALLVTESDRPLEGGVVVIAGGEIESLEEKPAVSDAHSRVVSTGVWRFPTELLDGVRAVYDEGEHQFSVAMARLVEGGLGVRTLRAKRWLDANYPWDLLSMNAILLQTKLQEGAGRDVDVHPAAVIDGVVSIGAGSRILPGTVIEGPVHIGENCQIGPMAVITGATTIRDNVRIGPFARIRSSMVMEDVQMDSSTAIHHSIIGAGTHIHSYTKVDSGEVVMRGRSGPQTVRRLGLVCGEDCTIEHGTIFAPGTVLGSRVQVGRRSRVSGEHPAGVRIQGGGA